MSWEEEEKKGDKMTNNSVKKCNFTQYAFMHTLAFIGSSLCVCKYVCVHCALDQIHLGNQCRSNMHLHHKYIHTYISFSLHCIFIDLVFILYILYPVLTFSYTYHMVCKLSKIIADEQNIELSHFYHHHVQIKFMHFSSFFVKKVENIIFFCFFQDIFPFS